MRLLRLWAVVGMVVLLLLAGAALLLSPALRLSRIRVHRQDLRIDVAEIQQLLRPFFGRHLLLLSQAEVERTVRDAFPEVTAVRLEWDYPGTAALSLEVDPVVMRVAIHEPSVEEDALLQGRISPVSTLSLTRQGWILDELSSGEEGLPLLHVVDWATRPTHRDRLLAPSDLLTLERARRELAGEFGHHLGAIVLYLRAQEFHVRTERLTLWISLRSPLDEQLQRYRTFLRTVPIEEVSAYVDLRLHDRVVYR